MKVQDVMTKNPISISPDDKVGYALGIIDKFHIWSIPVVKKEDVVGIITKQDIYLKSEGHEQKVSAIMSKNPLTISPDEELDVAADKINKYKINALLVTKNNKLVGILTKKDIDKAHYIKIGICQYCYPRGDKTEKEIFQCKYCKEWLCKEHFSPREPMGAPFRSIDIKEFLEWKKTGGHPCIPYFDYIQKKEKEPEPIILPRISKTEPITEQIPELIYEQSSDQKKATKPNVEVEVKKEPSQEKKTHHIGFPYKIAYFLLIVLLLIGTWYCYSAAVEINSEYSYLITVNSNQTIVENELAETTASLNSYKSTLQNLGNELNSINNQINSVSSNLKGIDTELAYLRTGGKYNLYNPTYSEVLSFLSRDRTDKNKYDEISYTCAYFSKDVNNNAENQGIRCAYVEVDFPIVGHAIIAFDTTDKGLVYFEPQHDARVYLEIGKKFYKCLESRPGYIWLAPDHDDTIEEVTIYW